MCILPSIHYIPYHAFHTLHTLSYLPCITYLTFHILCTVAYLTYLALPYLTYLSIPYLSVLAIHYVPHLAYLTLPYLMYLTIRYTSYFAIHYVPYHTLPILPCHTLRTSPYLPYLGISYVPYLTIPYLSYFAIPLPTIHLWFCEVLKGIAQIYIRIHTFANRTLASLRYKHVCYLCLDAQQCGPVFMRHNPYQSRAADAISRAVYSRFLASYYRIVSSIFSTNLTLKNFDDLLQTITVSIRNFDWLAHPARNTESMGLTLNSNCNNNETEF